MEKRSRWSDLWNTCTTTTAVLLILKLLGELDWSWWSVLAPMWIPMAGFLVIMAMLLLFDIVTSRY